MDEDLDEATDDLRAEVSVNDGTAVILLAGEIDISTSAVVKAAYRNAVACGAERLVIDMAGVTFMDSSGLAALIDSRTIAPVTLRTPSEAVRRLLDVTGLADTFEVEA
jgi:anti-sigma B factor antagonist